ncbi:hypothetical protein [Candidatus Poriferisodalis sp.]|uniref:hypothetical protein n=1 Tax=Candidatus Poriferisodalis sp. TaxID=3101277 RepID=UPI003B596EC6
MISPRDDGIAAWIKIGSGCLAAAGIWLFGLAGIPTSATVPGAGLVVVLLVAVSVGALRVVNVRALSVAERGSWAVAPVEYVLLDTAGSTTWWRAARWPDGRYVAAGGVVAFMAGFAATVVMSLALWVLGRMSAPDLGVPSWWGSLGSALLMPMTFVGLVSSRRLTALASKDAAGGRASTEHWA